MSDHALLSPSASNRWLICTAAPLMEADYPETSSDAADKGTCYHEVAEIMLRRLTTPVQAAAKVTKTELKRALQFAYQAVMEDGTSKVNSGDAARLMSFDEAENLVGSYVFFILKAYGKAIAKGAPFGIEGRAHIAENVWGTVDFWILIGNTIHIVDLKTGRFPVSPENNLQLLTYGVGFLSTSFKKAHLNIFQDGLAHGWETSRDRVKRHRNRIEAAMDQALMGGTQVPGEHCKWCKAKKGCAGFTKAVVEVAQSDFAAVVKVDPDAYTIENIPGEEAVKILRAYADIEAFMSAAMPILCRRVFKDGLDLSGFKVIRGHKHKTWEDKDAVAKALGDAGHKPQLLTPNQAIKKLGAQKCEGLWMIPTGELKLVTEETRGKPVVESAESDFAE